MVVLSIGILGYMSMHYQSINGRLFSKRMHEAVMATNDQAESLFSSDYQTLDGESAPEYRVHGGLEATVEDYDNGSAQQLTWTVREWGNNVSSSDYAEIRRLRTVSLEVQSKDKQQVRSNHAHTWVRCGKEGDSPCE